MPAGRWEEEMAAADSPPLGLLLRQWRRAASLTQEALAERAGMSVETISALERGISRLPHRATITFLADALGLDQEHRAQFLSAARLDHGDPMPEPADQRSGAAHPPTLPSTTGSLTPKSRRLHESRLLGRAMDLEVIRQRLLGGTARLVTLVGPAGVGKTSLALEIGREMDARFVDGVVVVDLTAARYPDEALGIVGQSLGFKDLDSSVLGERLQSYLEGRDLLLILDNVEHVLAAIQELAERAASAPRLILLATSREPLHLRSEQIFHVPPLALPDLDTVLPLEELARIASVALFLRRARAINLDFALDENNAQAVAELVVRLDGLPLAIELAAARTSLLSPHMILERLGQRLSLLHWQARDLPERQQTLRSAIAWSYELLTRDEQTLFRHLGVFAGGLSLDAAEVIAEPLELDAIEVLASLVDKSLVQVQGHVLDVRYVLLESIRAYAQEQLEENGESETAACAHARYYVGLAEKADPHLRGREQMAWYARLEAEMPNLRVALRWLLGHGEREQALRLAAALGYFWWTFGYHREGCRWLEEALQDQSEADPSVRATALARAGTLLMYGGQLDRAKLVLNEAVTLARQHCLNAIVALPLGHLGLRAAQAGEFDESRRVLQVALETAKAAHDESQASFTLAALGYLALVTRDYQRASDLCSAAVAQFRALGNTAAATVIQFSLAAALHQLGKDEEAVCWLQDALGAALAFGNRWQLSRGLEATMSLMGERIDAERRARLEGALEALRHNTGTQFGLLARTMGQDTMEQRDEAEHERLELARRAGRALPFSEVVALTLTVLGGFAGTVDEREIHGGDAAQRG